METYQASPVDSDKSPYLMYDAGGQEVKGEQFDAEAQRIAEDFKRPPY